MKRVRPVMLHSDMSQSHSLICQRQVHIFFSYILFLFSIEEFHAVRLSNIRSAWYTFKLCIYRISVHFSLVYIVCDRLTAHAVSGINLVQLSDGARCLWYTSVAIV